jgi:hypothetical protein
MTASDRILDHIGRRIARRISGRPGQVWPHQPADPSALRRALRPADVLLVSGAGKLASTIKYLTQSTWSHAAIFVGDACGASEADGDPHCLVEVNLGEGCVSAPLSKYSASHTRICRPAGLAEADRERIVSFIVSRVGTRYDMRNVIDLARYLLPAPPVPVRWRRRMIALGSGEPSRAICSTMIALAFQSLRYPILPTTEATDGQVRHLDARTRAEILHIRHHSLFTPSDFDLSPYFAIIKPTLEAGFDYRALNWADDVTA